MPIYWDYLMENTHIEKVHLKQLNLKGLSYNNAPKYILKGAEWRSNISKRDSLKNTYLNKRFLGKWCLWFKSFK